MNKYRCVYGLLNLIVPGSDVAEVKKFLKSKFGEVEFSIKKV
jgi:hypothetical protein